MLRDLHGWIGPAPCALSPRLREAAGTAGARRAPQAYVDEELQQRKDKKHLVSEVEEEAEIDGAHAAKLALEVTKADKAGVKRVMDGIAEAANKPVEEGNSLSKEATNARIREKMLELGQGNAPIKFQRQYKEARKQKPLPRGIYDREA